nr:MAG TPA: hypothetical protein [Caudoviricetes sp.]
MRLVSVCNSVCIFLFSANGICKQAFVFSTIRKYDITSYHINLLIISE